MSMGYRRLGLAIIAACLCVFASSESGHAAGAALSAVQAQSSFASAAAPIEQFVLHRHRAQSAYCYPRTYWWFYRPYTTALDGHARCMPYFHYLEPYGRRGARPDRYVK
jgi:hypothetical protein